MTERPAIRYRLHVEADLREQAQVTPDRAQSNYLLNVLRLGAGDRLWLFNGRDGEWEAEIVPAGRKSASLAVLMQNRPQPVAPPLDYLFAPLKHARLDYMVQKAVEMGAGRLRPVLTRRTQVGRINMERARANMVEAAEQCGILHVPEMLPEVPLATALATWPADTALVFCDETAPVGDALAALQPVLEFRRLAVLIGPEGGFDEAERLAIMAAGTAVRLPLGPRILRADTAGVAALALVQAVWGDTDGHGQEPARLPPPRR